MTILCIGEAVVDLIADQPGPLQEAESFTPFPGGAPSNVALALASLGGSARLAASLGDDDFGDMVFDALEAAGVDTSMVVRSEAPTTAIKITTAQGTPDFSVVRGADRMLDIRPDLAGIELVHTSAFALSLDPQRSAVLDTLGNAPLVSVDMNFSPVVWGVEPSQAHPVLSAAVARADYVKCSIDDMTRMFGDDWEMDDLFAWGDALVILTAGRAETAIYKNGEWVDDVSVPPAPVIDTTGAGDAFWAGFVLSTLAGAAPRAAVERGHETATIKIGRRGPMIGPDS